MARPDCSELASVISKIALNLGSRPEFKNIDDVVAEMQKTLPVNRTLVVEALVEASRGKARDMTELAKKMQALKNEARADKGLNARIDEYTKALESGSLPEVKKAAKEATPAIQKLRETRDELARQVYRSEPAKIDRLMKEVDVLLAKIEAQDWTPPAKKQPMRYSKSVERLEYERDLLKAQIKQQIENLKPKSIWTRTSDNINASREIITSLDYSAPLRQGLVLGLAHPTIAAKAFPKMFAAGFSKRAAERINREVMLRENAPLYRKAGLDLTSADAGIPLLAREEAFMSGLTQKIPLVAGSQRAYVAYLNAIRADTFDTLIRTLSKNGEATLPEAQAIAKYVNHASGRGTLGNWEQSARLLGTVFFSPRYLASRFQYLAGVSMWGGTGRTRMLIAKEYAKTLIGLGVIYGLAKLGGAQVETDPRSSDVGKIRIGDARIDPMAGFSQIFHLSGKLWTGQKKDTRTGRIKDLRGDNVKYGAGDMLDEVIRFGRSKLAPAPGTALNLATGEDLFGAPVTVAGEAQKLVTPISLGDVYKALTSQGIAKGTALGLLSIFGAGVSIHDQQTQRPTYR